jgi:hypothetical protein
MNQYIRNYGNDKDPNRDTGNKSFYQANDCVNDLAQLSNKNKETRNMIQMVKINNM